jgi:hypothetical protein
MKIAQLANIQSDVVLEPASVVLLIAILVGAGPRRRGDEVGPWKSLGDAAP